MKQKIPEQQEELLKFQNQLKNKKNLNKKNQFKRHRIRRK